MSDEQIHDAAEAEVVASVPAVGDADEPGAGPTETVSEPAKVMRIASMIGSLLEEVRQAPLDEAGRERLAQVYDTSISELAAALSPDLREELEALTHPFEEGDTPSEAELRIVQAQLVGWLNGLFHGIQAALFAQQNAARQQLEQIRQPAIGRPGVGADGQAPEGGPGVYL